MRSTNTNSRSILLPHLSVLLAAALAVALVSRGYAQSKSEPAASGSNEHKSEKAPRLSEISDPEQARAVAKIRSLGAFVGIDQESPDGRVISIFFPSPARFTDADMQSIATFTDLQKLALAGTKITDAGLVHLVGLSQLRWLNLGAGVTDAGLKHLKGLKQLTTLVLYDSSVKGYGLEHLNELPQLREMYLGGAVTDEGLKHIQGLSQLRELDLSGTGITDAGLQGLQGLSHLERLSLRHNEISDAGLKYLERLTRLKKLDLGYTKVTDAGLEHLKPLSGLRDLYLVGTKCSDEATNKLQKALPDCFIILTKM